MCDTTKIQELVHYEWKISKINDRFRYLRSPPFYFVETSWQMILACTFPHNAEASSLLLLRKKHCRLSQYALHYTLTLIKEDKSMELLEKGIIKDGQLQVKHMFVKLSDVLLEDPKMSIFSITCTLNIKNIGANESEKPIVLQKLCTLSQNFKDLFNNKMNCDTTIIVKGKEYRVHKSVLIGRSKTFAAMFQHDTTEKKTGIIKIPDCDPDSFQYFLEFLYCGKLDDVSPDNAHHLFETAEKYGVLELKAFCKEYLLENLTLENWYDVRVIAELHQEEALLSAVKKYFNRNANSIFHTNHWEKLMQENHVIAIEYLKGLPNVNFE